MEEILIDKIVAEVIKRIEDLNRKKVLVLIRKDCMRNIEVIESMIEVLKNMDIEVHMAYECIKDENLYTEIYCKQLEQVEFPRTESDMEVLLSKNNYESILINYINLREVRQIDNMNIKNDFSGVLFNAIYRGIEICTDIYEFRGKCQNEGLIRRVDEVISLLADLNVRMFSSINDSRVYEENIKRKNTGVLDIDKKIITMRDLYNHNNEIIIGSDAIITAMAEDYIRDENILVRRR